MFKFVDTGLSDKKGERIFKRKRVFRKYITEKRYLSSEQKQEIDFAFFLFDKDRSGSIDVTELRDAMKALGIFLKKEEVKQNDVKKDEKKQENSSLVVGAFLFQPLCFAPAELPNFRRLVALRDLKLKTCFDFLDETLRARLFAPLHLENAEK